MDLRALPVYRVLLIEDNEGCRETLAEILAEVGYSVEFAANGQEALDRLQAGRLPHVILLDLTMPVMNGFEFRRQQLGNPALASIPVIVISALADVSHFPSAYGPAAVFTKPFQIGELLAVVAHHCPGTTGRHLGPIGSTVVESIKPPNVSSPQPHEVE